MEPQVIAFLNNFFSPKLEIYINRVVDKCLNEDQIKKTLSYIDELIDIPIETFIEYICLNPSSQLISSTNYTQCSDIEYCHIKMCRAFKDAGCKGLSNKEVGTLLRQDFALQDVHSSTNSKFGENVKGAAQLGLTISKLGKWYLSSFGYVFDMLPPQKQSALMARTLLRDPFYAHIFKEATHRNVCIYDEMMGVTHMTKIRRKGNITKFCRFVTSQFNMNSEIILHNIIAQSPKK